MPGVPTEWIEFVDGANVAEVLDVEGSGPRWLRSSRPSRRPHGALWIAGLVIALGAAFVVHGAERGREVAGAPGAASTSTASATGYLSAGFTAVQALAHHQGPLTDYIRQTSPPGACALVRPGYSPVDAIVRTAGRLVPRLHMIDSARTLDQFTGLCALEIRASYAPHAVLVLSISAAPAGNRHRAPFARLQTGVTTVRGVTTKYVITVTQAGWRIIVGNIGPSAAAISSRDLLALAQTPTLAW